MSSFEPKKVASPSSSGGAGFTYADQVAARILLAMLTDEKLLGMDAGAPIRIRFEQRIEGTLFDDLVVTTEEGIDWNVSTKSVSQIKARRIDQDILDRAWWMFDQGKIGPSIAHLLVIAQPPPNHYESTSLRKLLTWSLNQPEGQVGKQISETGITNKTDRAIWEAIKSNRSDIEAQHLLASLRFLYLDLDPQLGPDLNAVEKICTSVIDDSNGWRILWNGLLALAREKSGKGGELSIPQVVKSLSGTVVLKNYGNILDDWKRLTEWGQNYAATKFTIGQNLEIDSSSYVAQLKSKLDQNEGHLLVTGDSGAGKSVVLSRFAESHNAIYLRADAIDEPATILSSAGVKSSLDRMVRLSLDSQIVVIIDQLDRAENELDIARIKSWIHDLSDDNRVRLIFGCSTGLSIRQIDKLGKSISENITEISIEYAPKVLLEQIGKAYPQFANILETYAPSPILLTPRALDQLVQLGGTEHWPESVSGFLDLFWKNRIQGGSGSSLARKTARSLAEIEAELGRGKLSEEADDKGIQLLLESGMLVDDGNHLRWDHDSTGDIIRTKILSELNEKGELLVRLSDCTFNPLWRRAFQMFCITIVEDSNGRDFYKLQEMVSARPLLELSIFDSIILASPRLQLPLRLAPSLKSDPKAMKRFVDRFLFVAAEPIKSYAKVAGADTIYFRAHVRVPRWERWLPTARMVIAEYKWFAEQLVKEGLSVLVQYLEASKEGDFLKGTRPALLLAHKAIRINVYDDWGKELKVLTYRVGIAALMHEQKSASLFLRKLVGRAGQTLEPGTYSSGGFGPIHVPVQKVTIWPHGPRNRVDDEFQDYYLNNFCVAAVAQHDLELAKELFYACLIDEPQAYERTYHPIERDHWYGLTNDSSLPFFPATHQNPSINAFFDHSFEAGLDVVATMVDFSVERFIESSGLQDTDSVVLEWNGTQRAFKGDIHIYQWMSGNSVAPYALQSLLLTLESRLLAIEDQGELENKVNLVLNRCTNLAVLSVLVSVAKSNQKLLIGPLAPLLFSKEIDIFDISTSIVSSWHLIAGLSPRHEWWRDQEEAYRFSRLPHRSVQLRAFSSYYLMYGDPTVAEAARTRWLNEANQLGEQESQGLRVLAGIYDRSKLTVTQMPDGRISVGVELPEDVARRGQEYSDESLRALRSSSYYMQMQCAKCLEVPADVQDLASEISQYIGSAIKNETDEYMRWSLQVSGSLVGLKCSKLNLVTELSSNSEAQREELIKLLGERVNCYVDPLTWDDHQHWTRLVATNAKLVFGIDLDSVAKRKAVVCLVQHCDSAALQSFVIDYSNSEEGRKICKTVLEIGRSWAVEYVRRQEKKHFSEYDKGHIPGGLDLNYDVMVQHFIESGVWEARTEPVLAKRNSASKSKWSPSNFSLILPAYLELAHKSPSQSGERGSLLYLFEDLLEAIALHDLEAERGSDYDQTTYESWTLVGKYLPEMDDGERKCVFESWQKIPGTGKNCLQLVCGIYRSYSNGHSSVTSVAEVVSEMIASYEASAQSRRWHDFRLNLFGLGDHGFNVDWSEESGRLLLREIKDELIPYIYQCMSSSSYTRERFLSRMCRSEFSEIDELLFDAAGKHVIDPGKISQKETPNLARLLLRWSRLVKSDKARRTQWRSLLSILEVTGERLAWQVLAEVADTV